MDAEAGEALRQQCPDHQQAPYVRNDLRTQLAEFCDEHVDVLAL